jgi:hypothetical protein
MGETLLSLSSFRFSCSDNYVCCFFGDLVKLKELDQERHLSGYRGFIPYRLVSSQTTLAPEATS